MCQYQPDPYWPVVEPNAPAAAASPSDSGSDFSESSSSSSSSPSSDSAPDAEMSDAAPGDAAGAPKRSSPVETVVPGPVNPAEHRAAMDLLHLAFRERDALPFAPRRSPPTANSPAFRIVRRASTTAPLRTIRARMTAPIRPADRTRAALPARSASGRERPIDDDEDAAVEPEVKGEPVANDAAGPSMPIPPRRSAPTADSPALAPRATRVEKRVSPPRRPTARMSAPWPAARTPPTPSAVPSVGTPVRGNERVSEWLRNVDKVERREFVQAFEPEFQRVVRDVTDQAIRQAIRQEFYGSFDEAIELAVQQAIGGVQQAVQPEIKQEDEEEEEEEDVKVKLEPEDA